jgi:hypothetical protein
MESGTLFLIHVHSEYHMWILNFIKGLLNATFMMWQEHYSI